MMNWVQVIIFVSMLLLAALVMQVNACHPLFGCTKGSWRDYPTERIAEKVIDGLADAINEERW